MERNDRGISEDITTIPTFVWSSDHSYEKCSQEYLKAIHPLCVDPQIKPTNNP